MINSEIKTYQEEVIIASSTGKSILCGWSGNLAKVPENLEEMYPENTKVVNESQTRLYEC